MVKPKTYEEGLIEGARLANAQREEAEETIRQFAVMVFEKRGHPLAVDNTLIFPTTEICMAAAPGLHALTDAFLANFDRCLDKALAGKAATQ